MVRKIIKPLEQIFFRKHLLPYYPTDLNFEVSTVCNSHCVICPHDKLIKNKVRPNDFMRLTKVEETLVWLNKISKHVPSKYIWITPVGLGETILHPDFKEILLLTRKNFPNSIIHIATNGMDLNEGKIRDILDSDIDLDRLTISINFFNKEIYKKMTGLDKLDDVINNVKRVFELREKKNKTFIELQILDIPINSEYITKFIKYWQPFLKKNDRIYKRPFSNFSGTVNNETLNIKGKIFSEISPCLHLWNTIMVNLEGIIFPCCMGVTKNNSSELKVGVVGDDFNEMFKKIRTIRKENLEGKIKIDCKDCDEQFSIKKFSKRKLEAFDKKQYENFKKNY